MPISGDNPGAFVRHSGDEVKLSFAELLLFEKNKGGGQNNVC